MEAAGSLRASAARSRRLLKLHASVRPHVEGSFLINRKL